MSRPRFGRALVSVGAGQVIAGACKMATPLVAARLLRPTEFGRYSVVVLFVLMIFNLGSLGISPATTFHVARSPHRHHLTTYNAMVLATVLGVAGALVGGAMAFAFRGALVEGADAATIVFALASVPAYFVVNAAMGAYLGREDYRRYNRISVGFYAAVFVATLAALLVRPTALAGVAAWSFASCLVAAVAVVTLRTSWPEPASVEIRTWRPLLSYGARNHASVVVTFLNYRIDVFLVAGLLGAREAGLYAAAVAVAEIIWFFSQVSGWVLFARVTSDDDAARQRRLTAMTSRLVFVSSALIAVVTAAWAPRLLSLLYGAEYSGAASALRLLLIGVVSLSVSRVLANYVAAIGYPGKNVPGSVAGLVTNIGLNVVLIPVMGIAGAGLASAVSYTVTLVDRLLAFRRYGDEPHAIRACLLPQSGDAGQVISSIRSSATRAHSAVSSSTSI